MPTDATSTDPQAGVPALTGPVVSETTTARRTDEELIREIIALEKQFDLPKLGEAIPDAKWFDEHWGKPALTQYRGSFVAVLNGAVVGHGVNSLQLQIDVARKFSVHPQRFIIEYITPANGEFLLIPSVTFECPEEMRSE